MKTNTKYTVSDREVVFTAEALINATFKGGLSYTGPLGGLRAWAIEHNADQPLSCTTDLGRHGLYPCILANNDRVALALSVMSGVRIEVGNGTTYYSRTQMKGVARALALANVHLSYEDFAWGITEQPYADSIRAAKPTQQHFDAQLEEQLADSPF